MLASGEADAFATDDVLLNGLIASRKAQRDDGGGRRLPHLRALRPDVSRKDDPDMADAVQRAFAAMAEDGQWAAIYRKWFLAPTPTGEEIDLPMSLQLGEAMRAMGASGL